MTATTYPRDQFFGFWHRRVENARWQQGQERSLDPEIHLAVTAGLDALANHWAATFRPALNGGPSGARMQEFLVRHGDTVVFQKISVPDLVRRARLVASSVEQFARHHLGSLARGQVRYWEHDPDFSVVAADTALMGAAPSSRWVEKSRYGEILYSALRCGWVHEFQPDRSTSGAFEGEAGRPRYQNWMTGVRQRLVFPVDYLLALYDWCVRGFEAECTATGRDPARP